MWWAGVTANWSKVLGLTFVAGRDLTPGEASAPDLIAPSTAEISVALVDDAGIAVLNERFLAHEGPTDVLAFSLGDAADVVGDIYVGFEQASRQAAELGISLAEELVRLAIHGTLHVLGHEHPEGGGREDSAMFALQERLVRLAMQGPAAG